MSTGNPLLCPLRVVRHYEWVPEPGAVMRLGGTPSLVLSHHDVLEMNLGEGWVPVPVVEQPKPAHPLEKPEGRLFPPLAGG